eukprot:15324539-Ditylum_brightwellii.AAC.5
MLCLAELLEIKDDPSITLFKIDRYLTAARKALKLIEKNVAATRDTHLEELAKHWLKDGKGYLVAVIQNTQHCTEMKQAFQQMKPITKGITGGVVSELLIPNPEALTSPAMYDDVLEALQCQ